MHSYSKVSPLRAIVIASAVALFPIHSDNAIAQDGAEAVSVAVAEEEEEDDLGGASLKPHFGSMSINNDERFTAGLLLETNVTDDPVISVGPEIGVFYTNLTEPGFWEGVFSTGEDFLLMFPVGIQLAWSPRYVRTIKVGVHGTANLLYTRNETEVAGGGEQVDEDFDTFPGVGLDFAVRPSKDFEVSLRPDFTLRPGDDIFTITLGFGAAI